MRTTVRIDDDLLAEAKALGARNHRSLNSVLEDALREKLHRGVEHDPAPATFTTFLGDGVQPGVDLDDSSSLRDRLDEDVALDSLR